MSGQLRRGWSMARGSFAVLKRHPKLAILPMVSGAILLIAVGPVLMALGVILGIASMVVL